MPFSTDVSLPAGSRTGVITRLLIGLQVVLIVAVLLGSLSHVLRLRQDALDSHLEDARAHARVFEEQLTQTLSLADLSLQAMPELIDGAQIDEKATARQLEGMLRRLLFLRSLSIADEHGRILVSSNPDNVGQQIDSKDFQPPREGNETASFLRIGVPWQGRDLADASPSTTRSPIPPDSPNFFPVIREAQVGARRLQMVAALNPDYFINHFSHHIDPQLTQVEILDYHGIVMLSSRVDLMPGSLHLSGSPLAEMRDSEIGSRAEDIDGGRQMLSAYRASRSYPLFVLVHIDREQALQQWYAEAKITLAVTGIALLVIITLSLLLIGRIRRGLINEARLHHERQLAAQVFENSTSGVLVTDAERRILAVNPHLEKVSGFNARELIGQTPRIFSSGRHDDGFYRQMWETIDEHDIWRGEIINQRKDGRLIEEWLTISVVRDSHGQLVNYLGVFEDITEQRLQALRLKRQLAALQALNEIATIKGLDPREILRQGLRLASEHLHLEYGIISHIDPAANSYRIEVQVCPDGLLADNQEFPLGDTFCAEIIRQDKLFQLVNAAESEYCNHPSFREFKLASFLGTPIRVDGALYGTINFSSRQHRDHDFDPSDLEFIQLLARWAGAVIERMRAHEQLDKARAAAEAASVAKGNFLANMSHEIRTPMNGVIGMADLLLATPLNAEQRDYAETIRHSADGLLGLINDVLDFSKVEAGKLEVENIPFAPAEILHDTLALLGHSAGTKEIALNGTIDPAVPARLIGDPGRLRQILINLVGNAVKFTSVGSVCVHFTGWPDGDDNLRLQISVSDTGIGMAPTVIAGLFSPFFQGDASTTRQFGGTGLGLSICKRLIELMGGSIAVESTPGAGSIFRVELPFAIDRSSALARPASEPGTQLRDGLRVLLVEDNLINQKVAGALLGKLACQHVAVNNGEEALARLREETFDVVLMDCQMPVMDGFEATRRLRAGEAGSSSQTTPIVAMTANAMQGDREACLAAGMDDYLAKPVSNAALKQVLIRWSNGRV
ncbi:MAG: response regulator [Dechloromonas sp.]|nr:response regulator [Dechloromonas sp.]